MNLAFLAFLVGLLYVSSLDLLYGVAAIGVSLGLVCLLAFGFERTATIALILGLFTSPWDDVRPPGLSLLTASDVAIVVGFGLLGPMLLTRRTHLPTPYAVGAGVILLTSLVASAVAPDPGASLVVAVRLIAATVVLPTLFLMWRPSWRVIDLLAIAYVAGQTVSLLYAVVEGPEINDRYTGLSTHSNFFGLCALIAFALCLHLLHRLPKNQHWLLYGSMLGNLAAASMSGSRAAMVAIVLVAVMYPIIERSAVSAYFIIGGGLLGALSAEWLLNFAGRGSALSRLTGDATTTTSDSNRSDQFEGGWERFVSSPLLGNGFADTPLGAHNIYLQVAVVIGVFGLVGYLLVLWATVRPLLVTNHTMRRLGYVALAYGSVGMITNSMWDRFVWAVLALALLANLDDEPEPDQTQPEQTEPTDETPGVSAR